MSLASDIAGSETYLLGEVTQKRPLHGSDFKVF